MNDKGHKKRKPDATKCFKLTHVFNNKATGASARQKYDPNKNGAVQGSETTNLH